ncbi:MAG: Unknown protein [uncultured Sulfurovum sp.]|uniref:GAF domain-containing protein n=1 Tax=uncultured Sulfurovum sp. TaxID=269237 RepID=A0A6S6U8Y8_9BACT|nr:MAG: Unknown protein [uncultured Sulfurovum sp.]
MKNENILKEISNYIKHNSIENKVTNIIEIETLVKKFIYAEYVTLYQYNKEMHSILRLDKKESLKSIEPSFLNTVIQAKSVQFDNHILSNQYYSATLDNPEKYVVRGMLVLPIIDNNQVKGLLSVFRTKRQGKNFSHQDIEKLDLLEPLLIKVFNKENIVKKELDSLILKPKTTVEKTASKDNRIEVRKLKVELEEAYAENAILMKELQKYKLTLSTLNNEIDTLRLQKDKQIKILEENQLSLENQYIEKNKKVKEHYSNLEKNNKFDVSSTFSMYQDNNREFILRDVIDRFKGTHYAYILFEIILYATNSRKKLPKINKYIKNSKWIDELIDEFYNTGQVKPILKKYPMENVISELYRYEETLFKNKIQIVINKKEVVPLSLVLDAPKLHSIIYHLLMDIYELSNGESPIKITIDYVNKELRIVISIVSEVKNNILQNMFKSNKYKQEKGREGLHIARKLIQSLSGNINSDLKESQYIHSFFIPANILDFVS